MIHLNKIATVFCGLGLGILALTGCEGADIYSTNSPDWISEKVDSIEAARNANNTEEVWTDQNEDVYTVGNTDYTSGWWTAFSKYYVIPDGGTWHTIFNLSINPDDNTYYKNFALIICNDNERGTTDYKEYGAIRYDFTGDSATYNSQWNGTTVDGNPVWRLPFKFSESNQIMSPDASNVDAGLQNLAGTVRLTVDRSNPDTFFVKMTNGTVTKTYTQPYPLGNLNSDATDTNIRCFLVPEGSYLNWQSSNIEPIGGYTSANDKQPVSMVLNNVPDEVPLNAVLDTVMKGVTATVTYEEGVTATVGASDLMFVSVPDMDTEGEKTLIAIYNKTFKGENATTPITAKATFRVSDVPTSIEVTTNPTNRRYYFYTTDATSGLTDRTLAFDPTGLVVTGTFPDGSQRVMDNSKLTFTAVPAEVGTQTVTISTSNGVTTTTRVRVAESTSTFATPSPTTLGAEDNSSGWWGAHFNSNINVPAGETREFSFTNYAGGSNWNNWVVVLCNATVVSDDVPRTEYGVLRADNYGWGNGYSTARLSGGQNPWETWLAAMNGAQVNVWVTNVGNSTADVQAVMKGTDGNTYTQYYLGVSTVDPSALYVDFTVDGCHLVFSSTPLFAKKHYAAKRSYRAHRR